MLHPRVHVQAIGFHKWKYFWLGIIVTPWCMNVILAKGQPSKWKSIPEGRRLHYPFPAGIYDFISVKDRILGEYQMCSLMSPLEEVVSDHDMAVEIAKAALEELMKPEQEPELGEPIPAIQPKVDPEAIEKAVETAINRPISRRSFLRPKATQEEQESGVISVRFVLFSQLTAAPSRMSVLSRPRSSELKNCSAASAWKMP